MSVMSAIPHATPPFAPQVGSLAKPEYNAVFEQLYLGVMAQLVSFIPPDINIKVRSYGVGCECAAHLGVSGATRPRPP